MERIIIFSLKSHIFVERVNKVFNKFFHNLIFHLDSEHMYFIVLDMLDETLVDDCHLLEQSLQNFLKV